MGQEPLTKIADCVNILNTLSNFYTTKPHRDVLRSYADTLCRKYELKTIKQACEIIGDNAEMRFPSLQIIREACRGIESSETELSPAEKLHRERFQAEEKRFQSELEKFTKTVGQDGLDKYFDFWLKNCCKHFGVTPEAISLMGLKTGIFKKAAIFDLAEANGDPKLAVRIGIKKITQSDIEINKNRRIATCRNNAGRLYFSHL